MPIGNSTTTYGSLTKAFHWITALLILAAFPLGIMASDAAALIGNPAVTTQENVIGTATLLFSLHKTVGVLIFFVALARIIWAIRQPKPGLLNGDKPLESIAAETVHWLLYGSLVIVPLSGWIHHAATTGFAPIWWPFGQSLPFVPKDEGVSEIAASLHHVFKFVLLGSVVLHIAGAVKHHVIDRDATLRRMLPGHAPAQPTHTQPGHTLPLLAALGVWAVAIGGAASLGWFTYDHAAPAQAIQLETAQSEWQVQDGSLNISVVQMGSAVTGTFADWTAEISYSETPDATGRHGAVMITVAIASLTLGSVTDQAMGPDYFDVGTFPTATFKADLMAGDAGHVAVGTLSIRDKSVPVELPFDLSIADGVAAASGTLGVDRRAFDIGLGTKDEGALGFAVEIDFDLTAARP